MSQHYQYTCDHVSLRNIWGICKDYETNFSFYLKCYLFLKVCFCLRKLNVARFLNLMWPWTSCQFCSHNKIMSLVLFFCDILVATKHSVPVTEGGSLSGCYRLSFAPDLAHVVPRCQMSALLADLQCRHQGHWQMLKWFSVTLCQWVTSSACLH